MLCVDANSKDWDGVPDGSNAMVDLIVREPDRSAIKGVHMKEKVSQPVTQGINNVHDLNDLLNELWHTIPPGKERKGLVKVQQALHKRVCNQQNPDCWLCQSRYCGEMEAMLGIHHHSESEESSEPSAPTFDVVHWLNDSINAHMRARQGGQAPSQPFEVLNAIHAELARRSSHATNCMFCVIVSVDHCLAGINDEQHASILKKGFRPMFDSPATARESDDVT
jgi:hypothetical protein